MARPKLWEVGRAARQCPVVAFAHGSVLTSLCPRLEILWLTLCQLHSRVEIEVSMWVGAQVSGFFFCVSLRLRPMEVPTACPAHVFGAAGHEGPSYPHGGVWVVPVSFQSWGEVVL